MQNKQGRNSLKKMFVIFRDINSPIVGCAVLQHKVDFKAVSDSSTWPTMMPTQLNQPNGSKGL